MSYLHPKNEQSVREIRFMKLLLTSNGITNTSIRNALIDLLGKPIAECDALFIPTGVYPFPGGPGYAYQAIQGKAQAPFTQLGWKSLGLLELTALESIDKDVWLPSVSEADALLVWGGDPAYIAYWIERSGLKELLPSLLEKIVYVGVSAGSIATANIFAEAYTNRPRGAHNPLSAEDIMLGNVKRTFVTAYGAGLVNFAIIPHYQHRDHADASAAGAEQWAQKLPMPVYAIDDQTAIKVVDNEICVISEGQWKLFNGDGKV